MSRQFIERRIPQKPSWFWTKAQIKKWSRYRGFWRECMEYWHRYFLVWIPTYGKSPWRIYESFRVTGKWLASPSKKQLTPISLLLHQRQAQKTREQQQSNKVHSDRSQLGWGISNIVCGCSGISWGETVAKETGRSVYVWSTQGGRQWFQAIHGK